MPHVSEMSDREGEVYDRWVDLRQPNPLLLAVRRAKQAVRRQRGRGVEPAVIRRVLMDQARACCAEFRDEGAEQERFLCPVGSAIDEALGEPIHDAERGAWETQ